jgi:hypothetical protein
MVVLTSDYGYQWESTDGIGGDTRTRVDPRRSSFGTHPLVTGAWRPQQPSVL